MPNQIVKYLGIDVYHLSGVSSWDDIKPCVDFVMLKIGQGSHIDDKFNEWSAECERLNIPYGGYWYVNSDNVNDVELEADLCISALQGKNITFPVAYDYEPQNPQTAPIACAMCRAFLNKVWNAGYIPMLYTGPVFYLGIFSDIVANEIHNGQYELWLARYIGSNHPNGLNYPTIPSRDTPDGYFAGYGNVHFENLGIWQWGYWNNVPGTYAHMDGDIGYKDYGNYIPPRPPSPSYRGYKMPLWMMLKHTH